MKKIHSFFIGCFLIALVASCGEGTFLDPTQTTDLYEETVFADSAYIVRFLTGIYYDIGFSSDPMRFGNGGMAAASDEAEVGRSSRSTSLQFATGTITPSTVSDDAWRISYLNIRRANKLLHHLPGAPLNELLKERMAAEARFLRAWYYAILLKHYGGVPLIGDKVFDKEDDISLERDTYAECVNYIVAELDTVAQELQVRPTGRQYGRASTGAAMALKSRVLLYAASPLFNGSGFGGGEPLTSVVGYPAYDNERWKLAADAAEAVMDLSAYSLHVEHTHDISGAPAPGYGFYEVFTQRVNEEYILQLMQAPNQTLEDIWQPPSRDGGGGSHPYQELVSAFGMSNGKPITDPASGYDPNNPYENRDPRLKYTVVYDQLPLRLKNASQPVPVDIYLGTYQGEIAGPDAVHTGTPTGYYVNKMLDSTVVANGLINSERSRPLIRYAEILLNFAEAQNEYAGPTSEVYAAVEAVRERAGLNPYQLDPGLTQDEMREIIRHERRVELAFEEHRFWDVRRWMIAEETQDKMMHGMEVIRDGSEVEYNTFEVRRHVFHKAMYFWPIPQDEIEQSEGELLQNPYW